jgi:hypothetical protein
VKVLLSQWSLVPSSSIHIPLGGGHKFRTSGLQECLELLRVMFVSCSLHNAVCGWLHLCQSEISHKLLTSSHKRVPYIAQLEKELAKHSLSSYLLVANYNLSSHYDKRTVLQYASVTHFCNINIHGVTQYFLAVRFGCKLLLTLFLARQFLSPWWWRWYVPPKRQLLQEPYGVTSHEMAFFIVTTMKTSISH